MDSIHIRNKKAYFEYQFLDKYTAGISLLGTEIKSIRARKVVIGDAFCAFIGEQLYIRNMHIAQYSCGSFYNHEIRRDRVLLLQKKELQKLRNKVQDKGLTVVPLYLFVNKRGFAKVEIALATGKKEFDKRQILKERDVKRELGRAIKRA